MKFILTIAILSLSHFATASEYDQRARESYLQGQQQAATQALAKFRGYGAAFRQRVLAFAAKHGGLADSGECNIGVNYHCDGSLCTPGGTTNVSVESLGSYEGATFYCKINTRDGYACKLETGGYMERVLFGATCYDQQRREKFFPIVKR